MVTMSQKSSVPQATKSVSQVLMPDNRFANITAFGDEAHDAETANELLWVHSDITEGECACAFTGLDNGASDVVMAALASAKANL